MVDVKMLSGLRILVMGLAREGIALASFLSSHNLTVTGTDLRTEAAIGPALAPLQALDLPLVLGEHPLSLLDEARHTIGGEAFVFQSPRTDTHLERRAFTRAMKRITDAIGIANATPHDLRRTGATMMTGEALGIPRFVVSQILAHAGDTGGAAAITGKHYDLNDYLGEKRRGLDAWARALTVMMGSVPPNSNVVALPNSKPSQIY